MIGYITGEAYLYDQSDMTKRGNAAWIPAAGGKVLLLSQERNNAAETRNAQSVALSCARRHTSRKEGAKKSHYQLP